VVGIEASVPSWLVCGWEHDGA